MTYSGQCHCGALKVFFKSEKTPAQLGVRTCQCDFCRRVGACNVSDPEGVAIIDAAAMDVVRDRFALKTADFLLCRRCGGYIAVAIGERQATCSTLNAGGLRMTDFLDFDDAPMEYGAEGAEARISGRFVKWTPTRLKDAALAAANFGPY